MATEYYNQPSKSIPAKHAWVFKEQELKEVLLFYLKSHGTNIPAYKKVKINGLENHYNNAGNERVELIIEE